MLRLVGVDAERNEMWEGVVFIRDFSVGECRRKLKSYDAPVIIISKQALSHPRTTFHSSETEAIFLHRKSYEIELLSA